MLFRFYCDESYDGSPPGNIKIPKGSPSHEPRTYVVAGFFADAITWGSVETEWIRINNKYRVTRFHAAHLNAKDHEYKGWDDPKKIAYSAELLKAVNDQGKRMYGCSVGILADQYRSIISDQGRESLGHPYLACFKSCIAWISQEMNKRFPSEDQVDTFIDRNQYDPEAVATFDRMKDDPNYRDRNRLSECTPGDSTDMVALQVADLIAYEVFKRLNVARDRLGPMRKVLSLLFEHNNIEEQYFDADSLVKLKQTIETAKCMPNGLVVIPQ